VCVASKEQLFSKCTTWSSCPRLFKHFTSNM